jgi:hypothetical protein
MVTKAPDTPALGFGSLPAAKVETMPTQMGVSSFLMESMRVATEDAVTAELVPPSSMADLSWRQKTTISKGYLVHYLNKQDSKDPKTVEKMKKLNGAIRSFDLATIYEVDPNLGAVMSIYADRPSELEDFNKYSNGILQGRIAIAEVDSQEAKAASDLAIKKSVALAALNDPSVTAQVRSDAATMPINALADYTDRIFDDISRLRQEAALGDNEDLIKGNNATADAAEAGLVSGLVSQLTRGKSISDINRFDQAFTDGDFSLLSQDEVKVFEALLSLDSRSANIRGQVDNLFEEYRAGPAKFAQDAAAEAARSVVSDGITPIIMNMVGSKSLEAVTSTHSSVMSLLGGIAGLSSDDRASAERSLNEAATTTLLNLAFAKTRTPEQLRLAANYAEDRLSLEGLPADIVSEIDTARAYAAQTGLSEFWARKINQTRQNQDEKLKSAIDAQQLSALKFSAATGDGVASTDAGRKVADLVVLDKINSQLTAQGLDAITALPLDFATNPQYLNDPGLQPVFNTIYNTPGLMPEVFHSAFLSLSDGNLNGAEVVLAHYEKMKTLETRSGTIPNPSLVKSLDPRELGMLEMMSTARRLISDPSELAALFSASKALEQSPAFQETVSAFFGETSMKQWLQDSLGDKYSILNDGQRASVEALTASMIAQNSLPNGVKYTPKTLGRAINQQMDTWFPSGDGYVLATDQFGTMSGFSKNALSQVIPDHVDDFLGLVIEDVKLYAAGETAKNFRPATSKYSQISMTAGVVRSSQADYRDDESHLVLVDGGDDGRGGALYYVHEFDPRTGMSRQVFFKDKAVDSKGQPLVGPMLVSTKEDRFVAVVEAKSAQKRADELEKGKALYDSYRQFESLVISP